MALGDLPEWHSSCIKPSRATGALPKIDRLVFHHPGRFVRYAPLQKMSAVMPYPNPADIARMEGEDKNINHLLAGLNVGYSPLTPRRNRAGRRQYVRR